MTKELYFVDTLVRIKHLKHCHFICIKYTALDESLVTNTYSTRAIFATQLSSQAVYFIQIGGSALSNTYSTNNKLIQRQTGL